MMFWHWKRNLPSFQIPWTLIGSDSCLAAKVGLWSMRSILSYAISKFTFFQRDPKSSTWGLVMAAPDTQAHAWKSFAKYVEKKMRFFQISLTLPTKMWQMATTLPVPPPVVKILMASASRTLGDVWIFGRWQSQNFQGTPRNKSVTRRTNVCLGPKRRPKVRIRASLRTQPR